MRERVPPALPCPLHKDYVLLPGQRSHPQPTPQICTLNSGAHGRCIYLEELRET